MAVKVYGPVTPSTQRVLVCLIEKEIEFEVLPLDIDSGEKKVPEYLKSPPFAVVNVIQEGDYMLHESRAAMKYFSEKYKSQGVELIGRTVEERGLVEQWLEFEVQYFHPSFCNLAVNVMLAPALGGPPDPNLIQESEASLVNVLNIYEERLSKSWYLAGDFFSLADVSHLPFINYIVNTVGKGHMIKEREHVCAWWNDISRRPSWKKVLQLY